MGKHGLEECRGTASTARHQVRKGKALPEVNLPKDTKKSFYRYIGNKGKNRTNTCSLRKGNYQLPLKHQSLGKKMVWCCLLLRKYIFNKNYSSSCGQSELSRIVRAQEADPVITSSLNSHITLWISKVLPGLE